MDNFKRAFRDHLMVDLPPSIDELNEYGRYALLNEMHTMAAQIAAYCSDDPSISPKLRGALECIEEERGGMRDMFSHGYERPPSKQVVSLLLRCAELYLDNGLWYDLAHAELRLREKKLDEYVGNIKTVFHDTELTDRYSISSPIIELTLTRLEMITFFNVKQEEFFVGVPPLSMDPLSHYKVKAIDEVSEAQLMNAADIPDNAVSPIDLVADDEEYLATRESYIWSVYKDFRPIGSLFCIIYYTVIAIVSLIELTTPGVVYPLGVSMLCGFSVIMLCFEIASVRTCQVACCRPKYTINCIYPGIELYLVQCIGAWLGTILVIAGIVLEKFVAPLHIMLIAAHGLVSLIVPFFFTCCFFTKHKRAERSFKWVRTGFFGGCGWTLTKIILCILFTPGVYEVQMMIAYALRNKPSVGKMAKQKFLTA